MAITTIPEVREEIQQNIKTNNQREITGQVLQDTLIDMLDTVDEVKANTTGYYEGMSVGLADNLISPDTENSSASWLYRSTGGDKDVSSGFATIEGMKGNTIVWNQLKKNRSDWDYITNISNVAYDNVNHIFSGTVSILNDWAIASTTRSMALHKYYISTKVFSTVPIDDTHGGTRFIINYRLPESTNTAYRKVIPANAWTKVSCIHTNTTGMGYGFEFKVSEIADFQVKDYQIIDLTQIFGSDANIAAALGITTAEITTNIGVTAFERWLQENVGPKEYYAYDAGSLLSFNPTDIQTVGFNQYDNSKQTGNVHVLADQKYRIKGTYSGLTYSDGTDVTVADGYFTPDRVDYLTLSGGNNVDTCVHLSWSGYRDSTEDYEAYWSVNTDLSWIRNIQYQGSPLFPNGLCKAGSVYDEITSGKAIKRINGVNLGNLVWAKVTSDAAYSGYIFMANAAGSRIGWHTRVICPKFTTISGLSLLMDNIISINSTPAFCIQCSSYTTASDFKTAMNGVYAYYELATPIVVDLPEGINLNYKMDDFGTEEFINTTAASDVPGLCKPTLVEIGYQSNLRDKIRRLDDNYVSFTVDQTSTKTDAEKAQARRNIDTVDKDGVYPQMHVGLADNLVSPDGKTNTDNFIFRTTAGSEDVSSGYATLEKLEGSTVVWNQLVQNGDFASGITNWRVYGVQYNTITASNGVLKTTVVNASDPGAVAVIQPLKFIASHNYLISFDVKSDYDGAMPTCLVRVAGYPTFVPTGTWQRKNFIRKPIEAEVNDGFKIFPAWKNGENGQYVQFKNIRIFDLTLLGIDNLTTVDEVESWLAKNVGYKEYYPYDTGSLLSVDVSGLKTVGFNLFNPAVGKASLPGSTGAEDLTNGTYCYQITGAYTSIADADGNAITPDTNGYFNVTKPQEITVNGGDATTCVHLTWSGYRNGEYEPYWAETLNLDFIKSLEYTPEGSTTAEKLFPNGLCSAGDVRDEITATKAIKRVGSVDLGSLTWTLHSNGYFYSNRINTPIPSTSTAVPNILTTKYSVTHNYNVTNDKIEDTISICRAGMSFEQGVIVMDSSYTDAATFKAAMNGVILYYELATPIEVDITPVQNLDYRMDDFGTEEFVSNSESTPQTTSPYSTIKYMDNLRDKIRNIDKNFVGYDEQIVSEEKKSVARGNIGAAATSGSYPELLAGNLVGQTVDNDAYLIRPTGNGGEDVASGTASVIGMEGNSYVWNQLVQNGDFSHGTTGWTGITSVSDGVASKVQQATGSAVYSFIRQYITYTQYHKYLFTFDVRCDNNATTVRLLPTGTTSGGGTGYTYYANFTKETLLVSFTNISGEYDTQLRGYNQTDPTQDVAFSIKNVNIIDLTLLGIDNLSTVAQVEEWLAQHVGTKPYYDYNAGEILSAQTLGFKTYGQNLLNSETKKATLIPYSWEVNSNIYTIKNLPSGATATYTPDNTGVAETVDVSSGSLDITSYGSGVLELSDATANTYVCMKWDGSKDDDVVAYEEHNYDFDVTKIYGKVNGGGSYVQCFPEGLKGIGKLRDELDLRNGEATVYIGSVDLGNLNPFYSSTDKYFQVDRRTSGSGIPSDMQLTGSSTIIKAIAVNYVPITFETISSGGVDNNNLTIASAFPYLVIKNLAYTDAATFKTAMQGVMLYYELATPITYTNLIYSENEGATGTPLANVLMNITVNNWSMEEQLLPAYVDGNPTSVPATVSTIYGLNAVEAIAKLQKTTYTESEMHSNLASLLSCINTNCSTVLGGTFSVSDTATEKVFSFTFTPNE